MKRIWKWKIEPECSLEMPTGAVVLYVQTQHGQPHIWALVDPDAEKEERFFHCVGTGHQLNDHPGDYIGTFQTSDGFLVFHVFERPSNDP